MASSSSQVKFIEKALLATGSFALSYTDPDQKWLIRKHLISFLQDFPNFELSTNTFNHNNGAKVQIFCLEGSLRTSNSTRSSTTIQQLLPNVELTIWIHEHYPLTPPLVFVTPTNSIPVRTNHPFINSSGFTNSRYIETWEHPRCNLLDSIRNLKKILANDHPFVHNTDSIPNRNQSVSRTEALDRLVTSLHYDALTITERTEEEIENLWKLQSDVKQRSESVRIIIDELEIEKETLEMRVSQLRDDTDVLAAWVETYSERSTSMEMGKIEEMFEIESAVEGLVGDNAIEDVLRVLEEAAERGELEIGSYLKQVRVLAREQFFCKLLYVKNSDFSYLSTM